MVLSGEIFLNQLVFNNFFFFLGGYQYENAEVISESILNLYYKFNLIAKLEENFSIKEDI